MRNHVAPAALIALVLAVAPPAMAAGSDQAASPMTRAPQPGMVWVHPEAGSFYRATSRYYGKTAKGQWLTEAEARAKGYRLAGSPGVPENPAAVPKPSSQPAKPKPDGQAAKPGQPAAKPAQGKPVPPAPKSPGKHR
jgi:hypothetical protein